MTQFNTVAQKKKLMEVNDLLNSSSSKDYILKQYLTYCSFLNENYAKKNKSIDVRELKITAGIVYKYNYEKIKELNNNYLLLYVLLLLNDVEWSQDINVLSNYLLDKNIIYEIKDVSKTENFNEFKERLFTAILFRNECCINQLDINKLVKQYISYFYPHYTQNKEKNKLTKVKKAMV